VIHSRSDNVSQFWGSLRFNFPSGLLARNGVDSLPVTLLIDQDGKIADLHAGMVIRL
jgi:hypothetical protein